MSEVLIGGIEKRQIVIADYDPRWPAKFDHHAALISQPSAPRLSSSSMWAPPPCPD